ncbi:MAG TPA: glycosyltransferase family 39 protein, partial [bacterium]|nr:glycosyltransferase family 39 protein [bacterium]
MRRRVWILILILLVACGFRLYRVTNPLLDSHHWQQGTTASIAWHYYFTDGNFFHALESGWGAHPKLFLNELPLFPYLVSMIYRIIGFQEIAGRLLSIFFGLLALVLLYLIASKYLGEAQ